MATPTPSKSLPQNAATPTSHPHLGAFSSPAPRSVPSPATQRGLAQAAGKSPFNASSNPAAAMHNPPTGGSVASKLLGSSPAGGGVLGIESPAAMLYSMSNISGLDGGVPMGLSISGLAGASSARGMADDEERRRRLEEVVNKMRKPVPRLSVEGLETLAKRAGLDTSFETDKRAGATDVLMAGSSLLVDVRFNRGNMVENVEVQFPTSSDLVNEQAQAAARLLLRDLAVKDETELLTAKLDKFARNLDYLGSMDRLSGPIDAPNFNCFEAISGVYKSLRRLFEHEKAAVKALMDVKKENLDLRAEREVLCKKSGRPGIHERRKVGLRLDYWMKQRHVFSKPVEPKLDTTNDDAMEVDGEAEASIDDEDDGTLFSLLIECDEIKQPALEAPARISDAWLADPIERSAEETNPTFNLDSNVNWSDPPPTYLKEPEQTEGALNTSNGLGKLPNIRFVAKLNPPLVVQYAYQPTPASTSANVYEQFAGPTRSFAGELLRPKEQEDLANTLASTLQEFCNAERTVCDANGEDVTHQNSLWVSKPDWGKTLKEISFSHPQELVQALPKLRQYALLNCLIHDAFVKSAAEPAAPSNPRRQVDIDMCSPVEPKPRLLVTIGPVAILANGGPNGEAIEGESSSSTSKDDDTSAEPARVSTEPLITLAVDVLPNAELVVSEHSMLGGGSTEVATKAARALDVCGEVGMWVEWVARMAEEGRESKK